MLPCGGSFKQSHFPSLSVRLFVIDLTFDRVIDSIEDLSVMNRNRLINQRMHDILLRGLNTYS